MRVMAIPIRYLDPPTIRANMNTTNRLLIHTRIPMISLGGFIAEVAHECFDAGGDQRSAAGYPVVGVEEGGFAPVGDGHFGVGRGGGWVEGGGVGHGWGGLEWWSLEGESAGVGLSRSESLVMFGDLDVWSFISGPGPRCLKMAADRDLSAENSTFSKRRAASSDFKLAKSKEVVLDKVSVTEVD